MCVNFYAKTKLGNCIINIKRWWFFNQCERRIIRRENNRIC